MRAWLGLTFDDGYRRFPELCPAGAARATGSAPPRSCIAGRLGGDNAWDPEGPRKPLLTGSQVREVAAAGHRDRLARPSARRPCTAPRISALAREQRQAGRSCRTSPAQPVGGFCYPYGYLDRRVVDGAARAGYDYGCAIWASDLTSALRHATRLRRRRRQPCASAGEVAAPSADLAARLPGASPDAPAGGRSRHYVTLRSQITTNGGWPTTACHAGFQVRHQPRRAGIHDSGSGRGGSRTSWRTISFRSRSTAARRNCTRELVPFPRPKRAGRTGSSTGYAATSQLHAAIVGLGYVGLPSAIGARAALPADHRHRQQRAATAGHRVRPADVSRHGQAAAGRRARLTARSADRGPAAAIAQADAVIICVPTPVDAEHVPELSALHGACADVVAHARPGQTIILTSTTYVGTTAELLAEPLRRRGLSRATTSSSPSAPSASTRATPTICTRRRRASWAA